MKLNFLRRRRCDKREERPMIERKGAGARDGRGRKTAPAKPGDATYL